MANKISSNKLIRDRMSVCITIEDKNTDYTVEKTSALAPGSLSWILIRVLTTVSIFVEWLLGLPLTIHYSFLSIGFLSCKMATVLSTAMIINIQ